MSEEHTTIDAPVLAGPGRVAVPAEAALPQLRTVVLCDLADSTALVERLGDRRAAELFRRHDRLARDLLQRHRGLEIDKTDGFLALFDRPIHAVAFALDYQRALRDLGAGEQLTLAARVGIHVGDVLLWENAAGDIAQGAKRVEVEGLAKPVAARLMNLARPGQILLSGMTHNLAQRSQQELGPLLDRVRWQTHGRYRFKGVPTPMLVHEVGEVGIASLKAPPSGAKVQRELPLWRRPRALAVEALVALSAMLVLVFALTTRPQPAIAFGERDWVVVGDLRNLTGDDSVGAALDTAFRISLEQSRFVNVLPDLTLRDSLARMQRPADAAVDRETGSEIALREGARALILPTVADIGGRIRVSAEIIDPHTQTTVYAEAADGVGLDSSLSSMDLVASRLRLSLGETLQAIERDSQPLPKVTSADIDALRAYAEGVQAQARWDIAAAEAEYRRAIDIDPGFALAHLGLVRLAMRDDDRAGAQVHLTSAIGLRDRLTARDALYADAWAASLASPPAAIGKWKLLGDLYPDYYAGTFNHGLYSAMFYNRYAAAAESMRPALAAQNPLRAGVLYTLGWMFAAQDRFEEAESYFAQSLALGHRNSGSYHAQAWLARGDHKRALQVLERGAARNGAATDEHAHTRALLAIDGGDFVAAGAAALQAEESAGAIDPALRDAVRAGRSALAAVATQSADGLQAVIDSGRVALAETGNPHRDQAVYGILFAGYAGARIGAPKLAEAALAVVGGTPLIGEYPNLAGMQRIVRAELLRVRGEPAEALALLDEALHGEELYQLHSARLRAARDAGRGELALVEAEWLAAHRGRALLEWGSNFTQSSLNLFDATAALLEQAELHAEANRLPQAASAFARFRSAWPTPPLALEQRAARLAARLAFDAR